MATEKHPFIGDCPIETSIFTGDFPLPCVTEDRSSFFTHTLDGCEVLHQLVAWFSHSSSRFQLSKIGGAGFRNHPQ